MAAKLCANCGGKGKVLNRWPAMCGMIASLETEWQKCKNCNGAGYIKIKQK